MPYAGHRRIGLQVRSSLPVVLAHLPQQGHGAPLRELAAQGMCTGFGYSIVKVLQLVLASFFQLVMFGFQATKKPPTKGSTKHGRRIPLVGSRTTLRDGGVAPILSNRIVLNLM